MLKHHLLYHVYLSCHTLVSPAPTPFEARKTRFIMALVRRRETSLEPRPLSLNTVRRQPHPDSQITSVDAQRLVPVPQSPVIRGNSATDTSNHSYYIFVEVDVSIIQPHSRITSGGIPQLELVPRSSVHSGNEPDNFNYSYYIFVDVRLTVMSSEDVTNMLLARVNESLKQLNDSLKQLNDTLTRLNETLSRMNDSLDTIVNVLEKVDAKLDKVLRCVESRNASVRNSAHGASPGTRKRLASACNSGRSDALVTRGSRHIGGFRGG